MRDIMKVLSVPVDGKSMDFRLTKLDAFSGAALLRMLSKIPTPSNVISTKDESLTTRSAGNFVRDEINRNKQSPQCGAAQIEVADEGRVEKSPSEQFPLALLFSALSDTDLRSLMVTCLQHCEVLLPAGWMPVMTRGEWTYPELEHDTAVCLKLTIEEVLWTLEGFFGGGASASRPGTPDS